MKKLFYSLKFYLISILAVSVSLYSCKKEPVGDLLTGPYYMRFKANGTKTNYTIPFSGLSGDSLKQGILHDSIISFGKKIHIFLFGTADLH